MPVTMMSNDALMMVGADRSLVHHGICDVARVDAECDSEVSDDNSVCNVLLHRALDDLRTRPSHVKAVLRSQKNCIESKQTPQQ